MIISTINYKFPFFTDSFRFNSDKSIKNIRQRYSSSSFNSVSNTYLNNLQFEEIGEMTETGYSVFLRFPHNSKIPLKWNVADYSKFIAI